MFWKVASVFFSILVVGMGGAVIVFDKRTPIDIAVGAFLMVVGTVLFVINIKRQIK